MAKALELEEKRQRKKRKQLEEKQKVLDEKTNKFKQDKRAENEK